VHLKYAPCLFFVDIDLNFLAHPVTKDVTIKTNEQAVKSSIRNLILTSNYEKPFHPEIGSQIKSLLFEPATPMLPIMLRKAIEFTIYNFEPRVSLTNVEAILSEDENSINVTVEFVIINTSTPVALDLILYRTR
jgi:phage baseplate assembly protein W